MCIYGVNIIIKLIIGSWVGCKQHTKQEKDENEKKGRTAFIPDSLW
jgi:hypothetical protein